MSRNREQLSYALCGFTVLLDTHTLPFFLMTDHTRLCVTAASSEVFHTSGVQPLSCGVKDEHVQSDG